MLKPEKIQRMAQVLRILAHADRLRMIDVIEASGPVPVHAIVEAIGLPQAATSQHLNQMKRVGLIRSDRRGKEVWYSIADPSALTILTCMRTKQGGK